MIFASDWPLMCRSSMAIGASRTSASVANSSGSGRLSPFASFPDGPAWFCIGSSIEFSPPHCFALRPAAGYYDKATRAHVVVFGHSRFRQRARHGALLLESARGEGLRVPPPGFRRLGGERPRDACGVVGPDQLRLDVEFRAVLSRRQPGEK